MARISKELNEMLNKQVAQELKNVELYRKFGSICDNLKLNNLRDHFFKHSKEEYNHSYMFTDYVLERNYAEYVSYPTPTIPEVDSIDEIGELYVRAEEETTELIEAIYNKAVEEKDGLAIPFLEKMLAEQLEEESIAMDFNIKFKQVTDVVLFDATFESPIKEG